MNINPGHTFKLNASIMALAFSALIVYPVVYSGFALAAKPGHVPTTMRLITREVSLGKPHVGEIKYSRVISSDDKHIAYSVKTNDGEFVVVDGVADKTYTSIPRYQLH